MVMLVRPSIPRGNFRPEQVERTRYVASALLFPILAFLSWILAGKLQRGVPRSTNRVGAITMLSLAAGLALWLYFSLREVDFLYLRFLYANLHVGPVIALYGAFLVLICVERRYSSRIGLKKALDLAAILVGVLAGLAVISTCLRTSADEYAYTEHFNAYFYSIVQVTLGKTLLVDLPNQYGFYPYFLEPLFRLIGVDVPQLTLTMGILLVGFFLILLSLLVQLARSRLTAICGFVAIACVWLSAPDTRSAEPYFQYWPHRLIFPAILLLLAFLHQGSQGKRKRTVYYALAFLACGAGMLWNFDTGVITFAVWVLYLCWDTLLDWRATGARRSAIVIAVHSAKAFATLLATLGLLLLYTYVRSGKLPDLAALGFYQSIFYQSGYYMRPMPLFHPWNLVALTYMAGLCLCAGFLLQRLQGIGLPEDTDKRSWVNMVFLVSVMGVGLFTVYQGRSHDRNLGATFWSVFFLLALFADALMDRVVGNASIVEAPRVRIRRLAMLSLPLCLLFVLFAYVPAFFVLMPTALHGLQAQLGAIRDIGQGLPNAYTDRLELMTRYFHPGAETPIFSARYNTVFYIETRTKNPVHAPGWNELILEGDVRRYEDCLARNDPEVLLVSDEFAGAFPDLYSTIREDYVEVGREGDLALFKWRLAAR